MTARQFTIEAVTSYPCPSELTSASTGAGMAWAFNEQGKGTCMWLAPARLLSEGDYLVISHRGDSVVFIRNGLVWTVQCRYCPQRHGSIPDKTAAINS